MTQTAPVSAPGAAFNYGISLPALTDSASLASIAPGNLAFGQQALDLQLKLHLLLSEHLLISHGFLYDNPALWNLISQPLVNQLTQPLRLGGRSTLIIQMDPAAHSINAATDPDGLFRVWAFGADGQRHLQPSASRLLGHDPGECVTRLQALDRSCATLQQYCTTLNLPGLERAQGEVSQLLGKCHRETRVQDRHRAFHHAVQVFLDQLSALRASGAPGPLQHLYPHVDELTAQVRATGVLSRSHLEHHNRELWWQLAPHLNYLRLRTYLPTSASPTISFLPASNSDVIQRLITELAPAPQQRPTWGLALEKLDYDAIFAMRAKPYFRQQLEALGAIALVDDSAYRRYVELIEKDWAPALEQAARECAKDMIVDEPLKDPKWMTPTAALAGVGFGAAASTLAATSTALMAATGTAAAAIITLSVLAARGIWSRFRVDTPEKSAHLVAARVIDAFQR